MKTARGNGASRTPGQVVRRLTCAAAFGAAVLSAAAWVGGARLSAQGRCIRAFGTPDCNTDSIPPAFARTGWRTTALDHITFRVADARAEAAFYAALMGWRLRSDDGTQVVMDVGDWGTVVFKSAPAASFARSTAAVPLRAVVEGFGFDIEPWNARVVEAELRARGMTPVAETDGRGFESFHVKDPDGFDLQLSNGRGHTMARRTPGATKALPAPPFAPTGWQTVWLDHFSFNVANYKASASFYANLLGWQPTYDEGSQNELMMADVGDIIIRGGNPLAPASARGRRPAARIDHISYGIAPWDTDAVKAELEKRGLVASVDTSDGNEIHVAQYKSYHTVTPNGYNLQISYNTHDTRLNLAISVNPRRPGIH